MLGREICKCKHPTRRAFLEKLKKQVEKHKEHLHVPILATTIDGQEILLVPPRTNNFIESLFRGLKSLLRRCSGRSKLPREFGSIGALLPYFVTMKDHPIFQDLFNDDQRLAEEFAKLFAKQWSPPKNLIPLPPKQSTTVESDRSVAVMEA
jgi:hypothetical protein